MPVRLGRLRVLGLLTVSVTLLTCSLLPDTSSAGARPATPPPRHVVFVGDSLTGGWYARTLDRSYPNLVVRRMHATMLARIGVFGAGVPGVLGSVSTMPSGATDVVVEVGTNDFGSLTQPAFRIAYEALIAAIEERESGARFVCLGMWQGVPGPESEDPTVPYDDAIRAACPGAFVSLTPLFLDFRNHGPTQQPTFRGPADWFHPNDRGHAAIAAAVESAA